MLEGGRSNILDLPPLALWEAERKDEGKGKVSHTDFHLVVTPSLVFILLVPAYRHLKAISSEGMCVTSSESLGAGGLPHSVFLAVWAEVGMVVFLLGGIQV